MTKKGILASWYQRLLDMIVLMVEISTIVYVLESEKQFTIQEFYNCLVRFIQFSHDEGETTGGGVLFILSRSHGRLLLGEAGIITTCHPLPLPGVHRISTDASLPVRQFKTVQISKGFNTGLHSPKSDPSAWSKVKIIQISQFQKIS